jgi:hypothetical protein
MAGCSNLVIEPGDAREILVTRLEDDVRVFMYGHSADEKSRITLATGQDVTYNVEKFPGGVRISTRT